MTNFRKLNVWQKAHALSLRIDAAAERIARRNPDLARQLERAAAAIPAAIAEGRGRSRDKDFARYVTAAIGESTEAESHLQRAVDKRLIPQGEHELLTESMIEVRKMLIGLRNALQGRQRRALANSSGFPPAQAGAPAGSRPELNAEG